MIKKHLFFFTLLILLSAFCLTENHPRVLIVTEFGNMKMEIYLEKAPITASNFLKYVDHGLYNGITFFRTVTKNNQPKDLVKIEVIQAGGVPAEKSFPPILHETTKKTGVLHLDGTISLARSKPGSATSSFFICIGEQKELDFGGKRNPDGFGFAAFGRIIKGLDIVRKIHKQPAIKQRLEPKINILKIVRSK